MSDTNEHSLSLSYQIRRAIKAEDALTVAQKEIEKLSGLLNAAYVSREEKEKQYDEALCVVAEQRDTRKLRIRQHLANRYAYMFKEFCEELEEILYAPLVTAAQQAQVNSDAETEAVKRFGHTERAEAFVAGWVAAQQAQPVCGYDDTTGNCTRVNCCKQAQPERAPSVPEGWKVVPVVPTVEMIEAAVDHFFAEARPQYRVKAHRIYADMIAAAPAIKQGGQ